jgi:hypothetical protein
MSWLRGVSQPGYTVVMRADSLAQRGPGLQSHAERSRKMASRFGLAPPIGFLWKCTCFVGKSTAAPTLQAGAVYGPARMAACASRWGRALGGFQ